MTVTQAYALARSRSERGLTEHVVSDQVFNLDASIVSR